MPQLLTLPNELLDKIVDQVHPNDIINFSLVCKPIRDLAKTAVSLHLQRKRTYEVILLHGCYRHTPDQHPLALIRAICMDWRVAEYPKFLKFRCCHFPGHPENGLEEDYTEDAKRYEVEKTKDDIYVEETMGVIQDYIEEKVLGLGVPKSIRSGQHGLRVKIPIAARLDVEGACSEVNEGDRYAMLALLLLFIPNLEAICLAESTWGLVTERLECAIRWMAEKNLQGSPRARKFLLKLSQVSFLGSTNANEGEDFEAFSAFAALPSVRKLHGTFVEGYDEAEWTWVLPHHISNVTEITLLRSAVKAKYLAELLVGIKALKRFTYDHREELNDPQNGMEAHKMVGTLLEHAKHSLEYLALTNRDKLSEFHEVRDEEHDIHPCNGSLRDFEVLKEVVLDSWIYVDSFPCDGSNPDTEMEVDHCHTIGALIDILPPSIETVQLAGLEVVHHAQGLLVNFFEQKESRLPKLSKLIIEIRNYRPGSHWERSLRESCAKVGVELWICPR